MASWRFPEKRAWLLNAGLAVVVAASLLAGPRLIDGFAALQWVRYHAAHGPASSRPPEHLRGAARHGARAIELLAPLPWATEAARRAVDLGRQLEQPHAAAACALYAEIRAALDRTRASGWRGAGLGELADQVWRLELAARARAGEGGE